MLMTPSLELLATDRLRAKRSKTLCFADRACPEGAVKRNEDNLIRWVEKMILLIDYSYA